ncbi:hypothetical protein L6452_18955 [Arctium lappa]|uniref:Uncharacterized protein n=1 Tax=Arctium lappa TaxID=4217 RepID=A0ACB9B845_ARCLA|nr:hypothetical protein L6452_18955 [Arctium lappa]
MPSSRSDFQVPHDANPDLFLISPAEMKPQQPNNHHLQFSIHIEPLVLDILRNHLLRNTLTTVAVVPELYVQQAWKTIRFTHVKEQGKRILVFKLEIDHFISVLTQERLRFISLPSETAREGRTSYDELPSDAEFFKGIRDMGYLGQMTQVSHFKKNYLLPFYYTLFSVINRCLTTKIYGTDNVSIHILKLFYSIVHDLHIDYA